MCQGHGGYTVYPKVLTLKKKKQNLILNPEQA